MGLVFRLKFEVDYCKRLTIFREINNKFKGQQKEKVVFCWEDKNLFPFLICHYNLAKISCPTHNHFQYKKFQKGSYCPSPTKE